MSNQEKQSRYKIIPITVDDEKNLTIRYDSFDSIYGHIFVAATDKGICYLGIGDEPEMLEELKKRFQNAVLVKQKNQMIKDAVTQVSNPNATTEITFHLKGTEFQLNVWDELLNTKVGETCSYMHIAEKIGRPKAVRAVASAIGQNPVTFLIPCHRIIRSDGTLGGYYWGLDIKKKILKHESTI